MRSYLFCMILKRIYYKDIYLVMIISSCSLEICEKSCVDLGGWVRRRSLNESRKVFEMNINIDMICNLIPFYYSISINSWVKNTWLAFPPGGSSTNHQNAEGRPHNMLPRSLTSKTCLSLYSESHSQLQKAKKHQICWTLRSSRGKSRPLAAQAPPLHPAQRQNLLS
jgi:hypothetical protein